MKRRTARRVKREKKLFSFRFVVKAKNETISLSFACLIGWRVVQLVGDDVRGPKRSNGAKDGFDESVHYDHYHHDK